MLGDCYVSLLLGAALTNSFSLQLPPASEYPKARQDLHPLSLDESSSPAVKRISRAFRVLGSSLYEFHSALSRLLCLVFTSVLWRQIQRAAAKPAEPASAASPTTRGPRVHEPFLLNPH